MSNNKTPIFFIDGLNNTGKTLIKEKLTKKLQLKGYSVLDLYQPYFDKTREILLNNDKLSLKDQYRLFSSDRKTLMNYIENIQIKSIIPNNVIICDRSFISSLLYQSDLVNEDGIGHKTVINDSHGYYDDYNITPINYLIVNADSEVIAERHNSNTDKQDFRDTNCRDRIINNKAKMRKIKRYLQSEYNYDNITVRDNNNKSDLENIVNESLDMIVSYLKD